MDRRSCLEIDTDYQEVSVLKPDVNCLKSASFFQVRHLNPALDMGFDQRCYTPFSAFVCGVCNTPIQLVALPVHEICRFSGFVRPQVSFLHQHDVVFGCLDPVRNFPSPHCDV